MGMVCTQLLRYWLWASHVSLALSQVTCVVHNFQSRRPSGRRLSPWEDLGQAPTMDSPLEKLSVAQVRGAGVSSRLERVAGGGGPRRQEVRQNVGGRGSSGHGEIEGLLISVDLGPGGQSPQREGYVVVNPGKFKLPFPPGSPPDEPPHGCGQWGPGGR